jgi:putative colanic acid biosynthesis glycosyltransferase
MNKGLDRANGDFVNFMNAGDRFYDRDILNRVVSMIEDSISVYFGRAEVISEYSTWLHPAKNISNQDIDTWLKKEAPNHQALFFPKVFYINKRYNLEYTIFADADYKNRAKDYSGFKFIDLIICKFEFGGISSGFDSYKHVKTMMKEAWKMGIKDRSIFHSFKRIIVYNIKYILRKLLKEEIYLKIIKKIRN